MLILEPSIVLHESTDTLIYYQPDSIYDVPIVVKVLKVPYATTERIEQFNNEYDIGKNLTITGVRKVLGKTMVDTTLGKKIALHLAFFDGETIAKLIKIQREGVFNVRYFLQIACKISQILLDLHQSELIHRALSSANILLNTYNDEVCIVDFASATKLNKQRQVAAQLKMFEGFLHYLAPEQTGQQGQLVDSRTDLYALGIVFYEMLTGKLPFTGKDAVGIVHAQMTQKLIAPHQVNPKIPKVLSKIIVKLLNKKPENRYQSALGLLYDLERCKQLFLDVNTNDSLVTENFDFIIGQYDFSSTFSIADKVYGRTEEIETFTQIYNRVRNGATELLLINGEAGIGKSTLVKHFYKKTLLSGAYFITGKFEQFQGNGSEPYSAWIQAFETFVELLLTESSDEIEDWKKYILEAVGDNGKVLTNVIPSLKYIIGAQKEIPVVDGIETQHRFSYVFKKFVKAITSPQKPLVIFIDDWQWADRASLSLLETLMVKTTIKNLLIIGTYRKNEVTSVHPFALCTTQIEQRKGIMFTIALHNLSVIAIVQMLSDSFSAHFLEQPDTDLKELAELVHKKTKGNPFFVKTFLMALYEEGLLKFNTKNVGNSGYWHWDIDTLYKRAVGANVAQLIQQKVNKTNKNVLNLLQIAACVGRRFDLDTLAELDGNTKLKTAFNLHKAVNEGFLIPFNKTWYEEVEFDHNTLNVTYCFAHHMIQKTIYDAVAVHKKKEIHLSIARLLHKNNSNKNLVGDVFNCVNQYNFGTDLIETKEERLLLVKLNLTAGIAAKKANAYEQAFELFKKGIDILPENTWHDNYELTYNLYLNAFECDYFRGNFTSAQYWMKLIFEQVKGLYDKIKVYEMYSMALCMQMKPDEAVKYGLESLGLLDLNINPNPNGYHVLVEVLKATFAQKFRSVESLLHQPRANDVKLEAIERIIRVITPTLYFTNPMLFPVLLCLHARISMEKGHTDFSAYAYMVYGMFLAGFTNQIDKGCRFGQMALKLYEKFPNPKVKVQIVFLYNAFIVHWKEDLNNTLVKLRQNYDDAYALGDREYAYQSIAMFVWHSFFCGKRLDDLYLKAQQLNNNVPPNKQLVEYQISTVLFSFLNNYCSPIHNGEPIIGNNKMHQEQLMRYYEKTGNDTFSAIMNLMALMLNYNYGYYDKALMYYQKMQAYVKAIQGGVFFVMMHFYGTLVMLEICKEKPTKKLLDIARKNKKQLLKWSKISPVNYYHRWCLVEAEYCQVKGDYKAAKFYYDEVIDLCQQKGNLGEEALANELTAAFYLKQKRLRLAKMYMKGAYNAYYTWGAVAKVSQLKKQYPVVIGAITNENDCVYFNQKRITRQHLLNLDTILKASATISSEFVLEKLLKKLMAIAIENAGAQKGFLVLNDNDKLIVVAEAFVVGKIIEVEVMMNQPIQQSKKMSKSVLQYVMRTQKNLLIKDARNHELFRYSTYIQNQKTLSVLCVPVITQGKFLGLLYLENNSLKDAFKESDLELLRLLSGQIATSIDNATLYKNLENKVKERTYEIENKKKEIELSKSMLELEKYKSDQLLGNILPESTAKELKELGYAIPRSYDMVTIMFTDFKGFTKLAEKLSPEKIVDELNHYFVAFDAIISKYGLEKIKTIGDAYMCVGGIPEENTTNAIDAVKAGLEMQQFMAKEAIRKEIRGEQVWELRIGIHTGKVVAGVVGNKKFAYDVWGDAVNVAARLEQHSEVGKVNVSNNTYRHIKDVFNCRYRGKIKAKNKGNVDMYFVEN